MSSKAIEKKEKEVEELKAVVEKAPSTYVIEYRGLNVEKTTELRNKLRKEKNTLKVIKNNIAQRAFENLGHKSMKEYMTGPNAFVFSEVDPVGGAKILVEFAKKNKKLIIKSGLVEGRVISGEEIKTLAMLPNKDGMIAKLLGCLQAPLSNLAMVLNAVAEQKN